MRNYLQCARCRRSIYEKSEPPEAIGPLMNAPLKILYLSPCWPTGKVSGGKLRTRQIARALQDVGQVDFVVAKSRDSDDGTIDGRVDNSFNVRRNVTLRPLVSRPLLQRARCGLDPTFTGYCGQYVEEQDRLAVLTELAKYDLVWIYQMRTADLFSEWRWPRSVMDIDDVPSGVLQKERQNNLRFSQRLRLGLRIPVARRRERFLSDRFTTLCVSSELDQAYLRLEKQVHVIPNGFPTPEDEPVRRPAHPPRLGFIGIFEYFPNLDGIRWFIAECWPQVRQQFPEARLRLVGQGSKRSWSPTDMGIDGLGWVEDSAEEIATWSGMIVPIRVGGGTRIKIAEAFSRKCPIVSTSFGAYGYGVSNGKHLLIADSPKAFSEACISVIRHPTEASARADRAWDKFLDTWTWDAIRPRIHAAAEECLRLDAGRGKRR